MTSFWLKPRFVSHFARRPGAWAPLLVLALSTSGCALFFPQQQAGAGPGADPAAAQASRKDSLEQMRTQAKEGGPNEKMQWAAYLSGVLSSPQAKDSFGPDVDWATYQTEAEAMLDEVIANEDPQIALQGTGTKAQLFMMTGRDADALALFQDLHAKSPSYDTAASVLAISTQSSAKLDDPVAFCKDNRSVADTDEKLYGYMNACMNANPTANSMSEALPWAKKKDFDVYARVDAAVIAEQQRMAAEEERRRQEEERRRQEEEARMAAMSNSSSSSSSGGGSSAPSGPVTVSVTLRNTCGSTVKLFFGEKPKFGSGTYSSLGGNTSTSKSFREGDMVWIVDDGQNGISSATVSRNTRTIEVTSGCTGMTAR